MSLDDIYQLLIKAVDALADDTQTDSKLTLQQKLNHAKIYFNYLTSSHDEELSSNQNDLYSQEIIDLYIYLKALIENLEKDKISDPRQPSILVDDGEAQNIKKKMVQLYHLIESKVETLDSLEDLLP